MEEIKFNTIEEAIEEFKNGRPIIVADDEDRENEGDLIIPSGVRTIEVSAFRGCTGLTSITIPSSVKEIHFGAFSGCKMLTKIVFDGTKAQWNAIVFHDWSNGMGACTIYCSDGTIKV